MLRARLLLFVVVIAIPRDGWAQAGSPLGPEFQVNTNTPYHQGDAAVAGGSSGNFVVVWHSAGFFFEDFRVFGQRYLSNGAAFGSEFMINTFANGYQANPAVAADAPGNFVVVWRSGGQDGSGYGIFGQRYASSGTALGPEFRVNAYTSGDQGSPSVTSDLAGNLVVVWMSLGQDGSSGGVLGQRYASTGAPLGPEFRVNAYTTGYQVIPAVASDPSGNFVVVWQSHAQDGAAYGVFGQRYASSGAPLGPEFRVNTQTANDQTYPAVAADMAGNFVVVWSSNVQDGSSQGVFGQRFAGSGAPLGPEFRVNTYTSFYQTRPSVAADTAGNFVVTWTSVLQDGSSAGVFGQRYASSGAALGPEFRVNTYTTGKQYRPAVFSRDTGTFVVVWTSYQNDIYGEIFGQRYAQIEPVDLTTFSVD
jgi:hypothetical protein